MVWGVSHFREDCTFSLYVYKVFQQLLLCCRGIMIMIVARPSLYSNSSMSICDNFVKVDTATEIVPLEIKIAPSPAQSGL